MRDIETVLNKYPWLAFLLFAGALAVAWHRYRHPPVRTAPTVVNPPPAAQLGNDTSPGEAYVTTEQMAQFRSDLLAQIDAKYGNNPPNPNGADPWVSPLDPAAPPTGT
jgi:hypothetical protein